MALSVAIPWHSTAISFFSRTDFLIEKCLFFWLSLGMFNRFDVCTQSKFIRFILKHRGVVLPHSYYSRRNLLISELLACKFLRGWTILVDTNRLFYPYGYWMTIRGFIAYKPPITLPSGQVFWSKKEHFSTHIRYRIKAGKLSWQASFLSFVSRYSPSLIIGSRGNKTSKGSL